MCLVSATKLTLPWSNVPLCPKQCNVEAVKTNNSTHTPHARLSDSFCLDSWPTSYLATQSRRARCSGLQQQDNCYESDSGDNRSFATCARTLLSHGAAAAADAVRNASVTVSHTSIALFHTSRTGRTRCVIAGCEQSSSGYINFLPPPYCLLFYKRTRAILSRIKLCVFFGLPSRCGRPTQYASGLLSAGDWCLCIEKCVCIKERKTEWV